MKLIAIAVAAFAVATPSKTVRLQIIHTFRGCHVWQSNHDLGPASTLRLKRGDRVQLRVSCPMDFKLTQVRGPRLPPGDPVFHTGTSRTIVFAKKGVYVLSAVNLQSSAEMGLQTLGADNSLTLTVRVS
ncbi:MAG: hypothetical protein ACXVRJ_09030 [Gaiellaceae bacterium]